MAASAAANSAPAGSGCPTRRRASMWPRHQCDTSWPPQTARPRWTKRPRTIASREEFRGTGGSLYFLQRQDVLQGSERVRIELRDKASGIVTGVLNLTPVLDYDIDYFQGRILLSEPLPPKDAAYHAQVLY